jgi:uncharacterized membrane protein YhaH (DUF805 family)
MQCAGDMGSGFLMFRKGRWVLRGIAALTLRAGNSERGYECKTSLSTIIVDVTYHMEWIQQNMYPQESNKEYFVNVAFLIFLIILLLVCTLVCIFFVRSKRQHRRLHDTGESGPEPEGLSLGCVPKTECWCWCKIENVYFEDSLELKRLDVTILSHYMNLNCPQLQIVKINNNNKTNVVLEK